MNIKIDRVFDYGTIIAVVGTDKNNDIHNIPFSRRMFNRIWDDLAPEQKKGKMFVDIQLT